MDKLMMLLVSEMAKQGPGLVRQLDEAAGGPHRPGHAVSAMLTAISEAEKAVLQKDADAFLTAAAVVLFLARDIAISDGKIVVGAAQKEQAN